MSISTAEKGIDGQAVADAAAPVAPRPADNAWVWQVTALSVLLGVLMALAINTTSSIRTRGLPTNRVSTSSAALLDIYFKQNEALQRELKEAHHQIEQFQRANRDDTEATELLKKQLDDMRAMSGFAAVHGPGLKVTLRDSPEKRPPNLPTEEYESYLVHDVDINGLLAELKAAGAEALAIAGADPKNIQRVVVTTTARCVGPNAVVNKTQLSAPYTIYAIGSPAELRSALEMPSGYIENRFLKVLKMIVIEDAKDLVLPEYSGGTPKYARPASAHP